MLPTENSRPVSWTAVALVALPLLAIFAPVLFADRSLAFRDTASFYYPLFEWVDQQASQGELPLWNPRANFGTPLVGEASSSLFYPGKAILLLPLEFSWKFKLYVVGHVFLAAAGAFYAARRLGSSPEAATLAAISYACGGAVLFQYCNVVFLVGAAWLPWALAAIEAMFEEGSYRAALGFGVILALMTLGGDPQMAYHAGLAAAVYGAGRERLLPSHETVRLGGKLALSIGLLATAAATAFLLSAVQTFPAAEAARASDRAAYHAPRNIYEAASVVTTQEGGLALASQGLFREPESDTHAASIYQFSFGPWHLPEYLWPNFAGRYFPQYRRWMMAWSAEPRMWNQSVYLGLLPLLLALGSLRLRRGTVRERWLSWCVVLAVLGSFGAFGAGWLLRYPLFLAGQKQLAATLPSDQVGGVYWFFVTFMPSYAFFRFPAKLLTFAACPLCLLAAQGLDRLPSMPRLRGATLTIAVISGVGAFLVLAGNEWFTQLARRIAPDSVYGPFDVTGARYDLIVSFVHTLVVAGLVSAFLSQREWIAQRRIGWSLVAITAADLVIANAPLIGTAPSDLWRQRPLLAEVLDHDRQVRGDDLIRPTVRQPVAHDTIDPVGWHASSSPLRLEEWAASDRQLAQTNHALAGPIDSTECLTSLGVADYVYFYKRYHRNDDSFWGNYWIMPRSAQSIDAASEDNPWHPLPSPALAEVSKCQVFRHARPFPRAWIVHDVTVLPELKSRDPHDLSLRGADVVEKRSGEDVVRRDFRQEAVVETDEDMQVNEFSTADDPLSLAEVCSIVHATPNEVTIDVDLRSPGLLVLADTYFTGWTARSERTGKDLPIVRTDRMFRGVALPPGRDRIRFEYRPTSLYLGAWISGVGWVFLLLFVGVDRLKRQRMG